MNLETNKIISIIKSNKSGKNSGIASLCSANSFVLKAAINFAKENDTLLLIEATSNQVNQFGGYTGCTPSDFRNNLFRYSKDLGYPTENILLGGDHLGPNAWQSCNAKEAMKNSQDLISAYVSAGFYKIHLDASMKCADDGDKNVPLSPSIIAERTAMLCRAAENAYTISGKPDSKPVYVIGTDVPIPGGMKIEREDIRITTADDVQETIDLTKAAFERYDLKNVWERVIAVVVQPGVEFGDTNVVEYQSSKVRELAQKIATYENIVYEAHSTDYQTKENLRKMVGDHFAILKVGPWLTYAFREAVFAMEFIEKEYLSRKKDVVLSYIMETIDQAMDDDPGYWEKYYSGSSEKMNFAKKYSYSDRIRYYWINSMIYTSLDHLIKNLSHYEIPLTLLSQFMPDEYQAIRDGRIKNSPEELIYHKISHVLNIYKYATTEEIN